MVKKKGELFMFCKNCGAEIKEGKFCPNCGVEVCEIENKLNLEGQTPKKIKIEYGEAKAGKTDRSGKFAKTGFILGLISLITTVAGYFVVPLPILGLVFSTKGLKSVEYYSRAKTGKGLSTAALISDYAFYNYSSLTSVVIGNSITSIGNESFEGCDSLTSVVIGNGVTSIGNNAFVFCRSLTSIVIGSSVTSIGDSAFSNCDSLSKVYYNGNSIDWSKISIGSNNYPLKHITRYYYSEKHPVSAGNFWHYVDGVPTLW